MNINTSAPVDLTNCDREPIHVPGSVQPFGFLLALLSDFTIAIASENAGDLSRQRQRRSARRPLDDVLRTSAVRAIRTRVDYLAGPDAVERMFGVCCRTAAGCSTSPSIFPARIW